MTKYKKAYYISYALSKLPLRVLYGISDFVFVIVFYVVRYRRKLVKKHLKDSFPEKSEKERNVIEKKFYHWFCDYFVETIKLLTATDEEMCRWIEFRGMDKIEEVLRSGQSIATVLGHFGNWEWLSCTKLGVPN